MWLFYNGLYLIFLIPLMSISIILYEKFHKKRYFMPPILLSLFIQNPFVQFAGTKENYFGFVEANFYHFIPLCITFLILVMREYSLKDEI